MSETGVSEDDPLQQAFAPLIGLPAWCVQKGQGSFLTMEFGKPHLRIRQPMIASPNSSERVRRLLARRQVSPCGEWHLWIYCCHWRVIHEDKQIACNESSDLEIVEAARRIDGQLLLKVNADPSKGTSIFCFDLGAAIHTWPGDESDDEQWMLYKTDGDVFTYRADGHYSLAPADERPADARWNSL